MEKLEQMFVFFGLKREPPPEAITELMQRAKTKAQEERLLPRLKRQDLEMTLFGGIYTM
jgi:hypothetical protein